MMKIKSWGSAALVMAFVLVSLQNAASYEVIGDTFIRYDGVDGSINLYPANQIDPLASEAGFEQYDEEYVSVLLDTGETIIVRKSAVDVSLATETHGNRDIGSCSSDSDCLSKANDYCQDINPAFEAWPTTNNYFKHTYCNKGICVADCRRLEDGGKCILGRNCNEINCRFGFVSRARCSGSKCINTICVGAPNDPNPPSDYGICDNKKDAKEWCDKEYKDSSSAAVDAFCNSGKPICVLEPRGTIDCTRNSDCQDDAERACTYGVESATCTKKEDCVNNIYKSYCAWNCKKAPYEPPEDRNPPNAGQCNSDSDCSNLALLCKTLSNIRTQKYMPDCTTEGKCKCSLVSGSSYPPDEDKIECGDGSCDPLEEDTNSAAYCPIDCRPPDEDDPDECVQGYTSDYYCSGKDLVRDYQTISCLTTKQIIQTCDEACDNGNCVTGKGNEDCGDGVCDTYTEAYYTCPQDCPAPEDPFDYYCGDGICNGNENSASCKYDCGQPDNGGGGGITGDTTIIVAGLLGVLFIFGLVYFVMIKPKK